MKLSKKTIDSLARLTTEAEPQQTLLDAALASARLGFHVFPLAPGRKGPLIGKKAGGNGALDGTTDEDQIESWWRGEPRAGVGLSMGEDLAAFDLDWQHGADPLLLELLPETRTHYSGRMNGNRHLIYRVPPGIFAQRNDLASGVDFKTGKGGYLVGPPTPHEETGKPYYVGDENAGEIRDLEEAELVAIFDAMGVDTPTAKKGLRAISGGKAPTKDRPAGATLTDLLDNPPTEGSRNQWLTRVAGHYAKLFHDRQDAYWSHVEGANQRLADPLPQAEMSKTAQSIWDSEEINHQERHSAAITGGWLMEQDGKLVCPAKFGDDIAMIEYAPWTIEASGVAVDKDGRRTYWVTLKIDGEEVGFTIPAETMGDTRKLTTLFAAYGADYVEPANAYPHAVFGVRLQRYLKAQRPTNIQITERLGLQKTALGLVFVTLDGVITEERWIAKEECGIVADPRLARDGLAPFHHGFGRSKEEAVRVLRQVLTFQEETTTSVFGAWWAAVLLKPEISKVASLFPFMGIEATSGSGKTKGFFGLMVQLNGNNNGQTVSTTAALRDSATSHHSGMVWVDDQDTLKGQGELLRSSTGEGDYVKKGEDNRGQVHAKITAALLLTGEALGFHDQKAMIDRSVILNPPPASGRMSASGRSQWDEIVELTEQYPLDEMGLSVLSGWYAQMALQHRESVLNSIRQYKKSGDRLSNKYAILVAGARLLDTMLAGGDEWIEDGLHASRVEAWVLADATGRLEHDNTLTQKLLPRALEYLGYPVDPSATIDDGPARGLEYPVWIVPAKPGTLDRTVVRFRASLLAQYWERISRGGTSERTEDDAAIQAQARTMGITSKPYGGRTGRKRAYELPDEYAELVLQRANYIDPADQE